MSNEVKLDFSDLEDDFDKVRTTKSGEFTRDKEHMCTMCGGTGQYRGVRIHQPRSDCFACKGKGYFLTSNADRLKAKQHRVERKQKNEESNWAAFAEDKPALSGYLLDVMSWNGFAKDLIGSIKKYGEPTSRQLEALVRMYDKHCSKEKTRKDDEKARKEAQKEVSLSRVLEIFQAARNNKIQRPKLRVGELTLVYGKDDVIFVKDGPNWEDTYYGKVRDGIWYPVNDAPPDVIETLEALATDPLAEAVAYGQRTGRCACCGRQLTKGKSIDQGIGPICAEKWGLA
jgi:hypothetical protein